MQLINAWFTTTAGLDGWEIRLHIPTQPRPHMFLHRCRKSVHPQEVCKQRKSHCTRRRCLGPHHFTQVPHQIHVRPLPSSVHWHPHPETPWTEQTSAAIMLGTQSPWNEYPKSYFFGMTDIDLMAYPQLENAQVMFNNTARRISTVVLDETSKCLVATRGLSSTTDAHIMWHKDWRGNPSLEQWAPHV
jgi:hypothetical protein